MVTPEAELKRDAKRWMERNGIFWSSVPQGAYAKPGDPDIIACIDGLFVGLEFKQGSRQSDIQAVRQHEIERQGGVYRIINSMEELKEAVRDARTGTNRD